MTQAPDPATAAPIADGGGAAGRRSTLGHILTVFSGNLLAMGLGFAANLWAMRGLGPELYGVLSVALVVMLVTWQLTGKGLDQTAVCLRGGPGGTDHGAAVFGNVLSLKLLANAALILVAAGSAFPLCGYLLGSTTLAAPLVIAVVGAAAASFWGLGSAAVQADGRFGAVAAIQVANGGLRLAITALLAALGKFTVVTLVFTHFAGYLGAGLLGAALAPRWARRPGWHKATLAAIIRSARWMLLSSLLYLLYSRIDLLMLGWLVGGDDVGVYAATLTIIQVMDMIAASTVTVFLPRFSKDTDTDALRGQVRAALRSSLTIAAPLALGYFLIHPGVAILVQLVGPGYAGVEPLLKIMFFGALFTVVAHPLHLLFYARRRPQVLTALDAAMLVLIAVGNYVAIRQAGATGAAVVVLASRLLLGTLLLIGVLRDLRAPRSDRDG